MDAAVGVSATDDEATMSSTDSGSASFTEDDELVSATGWCRGMSDRERDRASSSFVLG
jgi:hypothetical protein